MRIVSFTSLSISDSGRDQINVKQLLLNLESKSILKRGKYIKAGSRTVDSWMKILPNPKKIRDVEHFANKLLKFYQIEFQKYILLYENGIHRMKMILSDSGQHLLSEQREYLSLLREKQSVNIEQSNDQSEYPFNTMK